MTLIGSAMVLACGDDRGGMKRDRLDAGGNAGAGGAGGTAGLGGTGGSGGAQATSYEDPVGASGTRLRQRYLDAGGSAFQTVGLWDTEFETSCTFGEAADGTLRCLPDRADQIYFLDAACTRPIMVRRSEGCSEWDWAHNYDDRDDRAFYRRTETSAILEEETVFRKSSSGCRPAEHVAVDAGILVAEMVPSASFVRGTRTDVARAEGLIARFVDGEDGSRVLLEVVHGTQGFTCRFEGERCVPRSSAGLLYTDSSCTEAIGRVSQTTAPPRQLVFATYDGGCLDSWRNFQRGREIEPTETYEIDSRSGRCQVWRDVAGSSRFYELGEEIPVSSFPVAAAVHEGDGPLQATRFVDRDGTPLGRVHAFWDATQDEPCQPVELDDGSFGCAVEPFGLQLSSAHPDGSCSEPDRVFYAFCEHAPPRQLLQTDSAACTTLSSVRKVSGVFARGAYLDEYYFSSGTRCSLAPPEPTWTTYLRGADVTDALPRLELKIE